MELTYRKGSFADIEKLQALGLLSYGQYQHDLTEENWENMRSFLAGADSYTSLMDISTCFLCEHEEEIVGMAYLVSQGHPTEMFSADWSYIRMVGVNPAYGGKGIGQKLTQMCIDYARETHEDFVALHTSELMHAARHIYEKLGFTVHKELGLRLGKLYWIYILDLNR